MIMIATYFIVLLILLALEGFYSKELSINGLENLIGASFVCLFWPLILVIAIMLLIALLAVSPGIGIIYLFGVIRKQGRVKSV